MPRDPAVDFDRHVELFFGAASESLVRVYARFHGDGPRADLQLDGTVVGPECEYAQTLPAKYALIDRGPGRTLLAEALVPEPCFWTPQMPHLYQVSIELRRGATVIARCERIFGIRKLGAARHHLIYGGKRWVVRAVRAASLPSIDLESIHDSETALLVKSPHDSLLDRASRLGVLVIVEADHHDADELARLARWPAVAIVVLPAECEFVAQGNLLFAARIWMPANEYRLPSWAQLAVLCVEPKEELAHHLTLLDVPVIVDQGGTVDYQSVAAARAQCDLLQRELAGRTEFAGREFAGYIV